MLYNIEKVAFDLMIEPAELIGVLQHFCTETPEILGQCDQAILATDFNLLQKLFHSLKGSASNLRIDSLSRLSATLETRAVSRDLLFISSQLPVLQDEFFTFMRHIQGYLSEQNHINL